MRTREYVAWGIAIGMLLASIGTQSVIRGPTLDAPGEATTSVLGVVVDRVSIPLEADQQRAQTDRVSRGWLIGLTVAAVGGGIAGGLLGWAVARVRGPKVAEPEQ